MERNIHILPTDKPNSLFYVHKILFYVPELKDRVNWNKNLVKHQYIYITSDEEIKEGDWCINKDGLMKCTAHAGAMNHYFQKIILTTDPDLIADGVQSIPDEFLEWFVKNPSCDFVEVRKEKYSERFDNDKSSIGNTDTWGNRWVLVFPKHPQIEGNKSGKQQTAVEWVHSEYKRIFGDVLVKPSQAIEMADVLAQAKEMEKNQTINDYCNGRISVINKSVISAEQYYNEMYKKDTP